MAGFDDYLEMFGTAKEIGSYLLSEIAFGFGKFECFGYFLRKYELELRY